MSDSLEDKTAGSMFVNSMKDVNEDMSGHAKKGSKDAKEDSKAKGKMMAMVKDGMEDEAGKNKKGSKDAKEDSSSAKKFKVATEAWKDGQSAGLIPHHKPKPHHIGKAILNLVKHHPSHSKDLSEDKAQAAK